MITGKANKDIHQGLIDLCRENDRSAQIKIYELYYKAMYNTSLRIVNDSMEAEDIMQESFIDAFKKLDMFKGESSFGTWLKRIVVNKSLDSIKKRKLFTADMEKEFVLVEENDPAEAEFVFGEVVKIKEALNNLPDPYRIILSLHLLEGYDHQEIAEILKISYNNVRTRYSRARQKLISDLKNTSKEFMNTLKN